MANVDDWVHRFHTGTVSGTVAGIVDVDPGRSWPIRMLRWLMRLPPPAVRQTARLCIVRRAEGAGRMISSTLTGPWLASAAHTRAARTWSA